LTKSFLAVYPNLLEDFLGWRSGSKEGMDMNLVIKEYINLISLL